MDINDYMISTLLATSITLIALVVGIVRFGRFSVALKYMFFYVVLGACTEIANYVLIEVLAHSNNMPIGNFYFFLSFLLLGLYFMHLFKGYIHRKVFIAIVVLYELYFIVNLLVFQSIFEFPAIPKAISDIILFGLAMLFFHKTMLEAKEKYVWKDPFVIINLGILLYFAGSLFYSVLFNVVLENARGFTDFTRIYFYVLNAVFYFLIAIGFWKAGKQV